MLKVYQIHTEGNCQYDEKQYEGISTFCVMSMFADIKNLRKVVQEGKTSLSFENLSTNMILHSLKKNVDCILNIETEEDDDYDEEHFIKTLKRELKKTGKLKRLINRVYRSRFNRQGRRMPRKIKTQQINLTKLIQKIGMIRKMSTADGMKTKDGLKSVIKEITNVLS